MQAYSDPKRESEPNALPDVEVFELTAAEVAASAAYEDEQWEFMRRPEFKLATMNGRIRERMFDAMVDELGITGGWFWQSCFPGCLPDSDAFGPFETAADALADARTSTADPDDDGSCPSCGANIGPCADYPWHEADEDCRALRQPVK